MKAIILLCAIAYASLSTADELKSFLGVRFGEKISSINVAKTYAILNQDYTSKTLKAGIIPINKLSDFQEYTVAYDKSSAKVFSLIAWSEAVPKANIQTAYQLASKTQSLLEKKYNKKMVADGRVKKMIFSNRSDPLCQEITIGVDKITSDGKYAVSIFVFDHSVQEEIEKGNRKSDLDAL